MTMPGHGLRDFGYQEKLFGWVGLLAGFSLRRLCGRFWEYIADFILRLNP